MRRILSVLALALVLIGGTSATPADAASVKGIENMSTQYTLHYWKKKDSGYTLLGPQRYRRGLRYAVDGYRCKDVYNGVDQPLHYGGGYHKLPASWRRMKRTIYVDQYNPPCAPSGSREALALAKIKARG